MDTTDTTDSVIPDLSAALSEPASPAVPAKQSKEHRSEQRYRVKWRASVTVAGLDIHGFIKDISTKGTAIFLERNLQGVRTVSLQIQVPLLNLCGAPRIIEVEGKVVYSNHDSDELHFRAGILFTEFKAASDHAFLETRLKSCHTKID